MTSGGHTPISVLFQSPCNNASSQSIHMLQNICTGVKTTFYSDLSREIWKCLQKSIADHRKEVHLCLPVILTCLPFKIQVDIIQRNLCQSGWFGRSKTKQAKTGLKSDSFMDLCLKCCCFTKLAKQIIQAYSITNINKNKLQNSQFRTLFPYEWKIFLRWLLPRIDAPVSLKEQCRYNILTHLVDSPVKCLAYLCLPSRIENFLMFSDIHFRPEFSDEP